MTKPNDFRETYILAADVPYRVADPISHGTHAGEGTLHRGRVVWLRNEAPPREAQTQIPVFAEGVGLVLLDSNSVERLR